MDQLNTAWQSKRRAKDCSPIGGTIGDGSKKIEK